VGSSLIRRELALPESRSAVFWDNTNSGATTMATRRSSLGLVTHAALVTNPTLVVWLSCVLAPGS
jgi:hypothetical protein